MKFDIVTIFPEQITDFLKFGIFRIAAEKGLVEINVRDLRKWTDDNHKSVDDRVFGGGAGMLMKIEPVYKALQDLKSENSKVIATTPRGKRLTQQTLVDFSVEVDAHYIILCGHYEGFDERIYEKLVDYEISVGDFVLSGGELPSLMIVDGITRLIPGVLGNEESLSEESFNHDCLEYPQYTRPADFMGWKVPDVLMTGNHKKIEEWRKLHSKKVCK